MALGNTHHYDGHLHDLLGTIYTQYDIVVGTPVDVLDTRIRSVLPKLHGYALSFASGILAKGPGRIFDPSNRFTNGEPVDAYYLLALIVPMTEHVDSGSDVLSTLQTQLEEIALGTCAQGYTTRLLQVIHAHLN